MPLTRIPEALPFAKWGGNHGQQRTGKKGLETGLWGSIRIEALALVWQKAWLMALNVALSHSPGSCLDNLTNTGKM